jgi:hypothetical protein
MSDGKITEGLKGNIRALLEREDYEALLEMAEKERPVLRLLISMTYDKTDVISWRATGAIGLITATMPEEKARSTIQRMLWMMREESGTNPWGAAEVIGEIIRANPGPFEDIVPIVISFHEEEFLRTGVLWAMKRIAEVRPDLVEPFVDVPLEYQKSKNPSERGFSILVLGALGRKEHIPLLEQSLGDNDTIGLYDGASIIERPISALASEAIESLKN